jgi:hypothetical protein
MDLERLQRLHRPEEKCLGCAEHFEDVRAEEFCWYWGYVVVLTERIEIIVSRVVVRYWCQEAEQSFVVDIWLPIMCHSQISAVLLCNRDCFVVDGKPICGVNRRRKGR